MISKPFYSQSGVRPLTLISRSHLKIMNTSKISAPITICCAGLLLAFFMPWAQIGPLGVSGYNFGKLSSQAYWLWLIPLSAVATITAGLSGADQRTYAMFAGLIPIVCFIYTILNFGDDLFQVLAIGVYITLGLAISLIGIAFFVPIPGSPSLLDKFKVLLSEGQPRDRCCPKCGTSYHWLDRLTQPICCAKCWTVEKERLRQEKLAENFKA